MKKFLSLAVVSALVMSAVAFGQTDKKDHMDKKPMMGGHMMKKKGHMMKKKGHMMKKGEKMGHMMKKGDMKKKHPMMMKKKS